MTDKPILRPDREETALTHHVDVDSARMELRTIDEELANVQRDTSMGFLQKRRITMELINNRLTIQRRIIGAVIERANIRVERELELFKGIWGDEMTLCLAGLKITRANEFLRLTRLYEERAFKELKAIEGNDRLPPEGKKRQANRLASQLEGFGTQLDAIRERIILEIQ